MSVGEVLELSHSDGATVSAPTIAYIKAGALNNFASDAAYVTAKGSAAAAGDIYLNTTIKGIRVYTSLGWQSIVGHVVTSSRASPSSIVAGTGIVAAGYPKETHFIQGSGGAVDITANPQISAGTNVGDELILIGRSDSNTVKIEHGTGLALNGFFTMKADSVIKLIWDGTNWVEESRNDI